MKANGTSKKGMPDGAEYTINVYNPTHAEWLAHFTKGGDRLAADYNQHKVANNLASGLKNAFKLALGLSETEKPKPETIEKAKALVAKVKAGETFDLRDFVAKDERAAGEGGNPWIRLVKEKWDTSTTEKREAFLKRHNLTDVDVTASKEDVIAALEGAL